MSMNTMNAINTYEATTMDTVVVDNRNFVERFVDDHPFTCGAAAGAAVATPVTYFITKAATEKKINKDWEAKFEKYKNDCRTQVYQEIRDEASRLKNK